MQTHYLTIKRMIAEQPDAVLSYKFDTPVYSTEYADIKRHVGYAIDDDKRLSLDWPTSAFAGILMGPHSALDLIRYRTSLAKVLARPHAKNEAKLIDARHAAQQQQHKPAQEVTIEGLLANVRRAYEATNRWIELCVSIVDQKDRVMKGRAPATTPRVTPARTIHNTGTCAICRKNVKMENGKIVHHGFTLQWGGRNGACFGYRFQPLETSNEALVAFLAHLQEGQRSTAARLERVKRGPDKVVTMNPAGKPETVTKQTLILRCESDLRYLEWSIKDTQSAINNWKPSPLPEQRFIAETKQP